MNATEVVNVALGLVGAPLIRGLPPDDNTPNALLGKVFFDVVFSAKLSGHNWKFAKKETTLSLLDLESEYGTYVYSIPGDLVRILDIAPEGFSDSWQVIGQTIVTDVAEAKVLYVAKPEIGSNIPEYFGLAIAYELAPMFAMSLSRSPDLVHIYNAKARDFYNQALEFDSSQISINRTVDDTPSNDTFVDV